MSRTVDLIAKLHRKACSARTIGHDIEAQAYDAKIAELLEREDLTLAEVLADADDDDRIRPLLVHPDQFGQELAEGSAHPWLLHLANVIAGYHNCLVFGMPTNNGVGFVGRVGDRDAAIAMFCRLAPRLDDMSRREMERREAVAWNTTDSNSSTGGAFFVTYSSSSWGPPRDETWRISWLCGAAQAIGDKLRAEWVERAREQSNGMGLVPLGRRRGLEDWVRERTTQADDSDDAPEPEPLEPVQIRRDGFDEGARAAWALNLRAFELPEEATA